LRCLAAPRADLLPAELKAGASTSIKTTGLKIGGAKIDLGKKVGAVSAMGDTADAPVKRDYKLFDLPPLDPSVQPSNGDDEKVGAGSDLEDEAEEEDVKPVVEATPMQVDNEEEEEIDPLDAFMASVKDEVQQVNAADQKRSGVSGVAVKRKGLAEVVGDEDGMGAGTAEAEPEQPDELEGASLEDIMAIAASKVKKKEMATVDHAKVAYEPFRKDFYHAPAELEEMTEEDAERLRMELDAIKVRGKDCPKPITRWSHCGLPARCLDVIKKLDWAAPTPIQAQAIPAIMSGRDVIGVAKTGSGKTMAFLLPMFRHIKDQRPVESLEGPIGIIMTPTRELAVQIYRESKPFLKAIGLRAVCVYGGAPISEQIAEMKKTAEIVVATPGRMIDLLTANSGRVTNLKRATYLVLDEADRMFDMGFEPQVMKIVNNIRPDRQTVLFSATFPKQMESLARKVLRNKPVEVTVGGRSVVAPEIEQIVEVREEET
jgi:ATP-dependent RNA helicase DDX46/PRP5